MTREEIKSEIAGIDKKLKAPLPPIFVDKLKAKRAAFEEELKKMDETEKPEKKEVAPKKETPVKDKDKPKVVSVAPKAKGKPAKVEKKEKADGGKKASGKSIMEFQGKEITQEAIDYCEALLAKHRERRASYKSRPKKGVTEKVVEKATSAAIDAIEETPAANIKKNPKAAIAKFEKLEKATKEFVSALKEVLGSKYKSSQADKILKQISSFIAEIKKKYKK